MALLELTEAGLHCAPGSFHVDPWEKVELALVTHAHADRVAPGCARYVCTGATAPFLRRLVGEDAPVRAVEYRETIRLGSASVSLHPSGHVLGSAQVRIEAEGEVSVFAGDWKRDPDPTCEPFELLRCETFVTEATFALPIYRWPEPEEVAREILAWRDACATASRAALLLVDEETKAARVLALLAPLADRPAIVTRELEAVADLSRRAGVSLLETRVLDESERGSLAGELVLAPLARSRELRRRVGERETGLASGRARIRGPRRRGALDRGFVLSDHADWRALVRTIDETGARRVLATHGNAAPLARFLRERGIEAEALATPYRGEALA
ncbi:ligase-associated DNA damage response exonuclease [bacterium]|nr:ligase-associated DNA damage response exonuclease [bacterium]